MTEGPQIDRNATDAVLVPRVEAEPVNPAPPIPMDWQDMQHRLRMAEDALKRVSLEHDRLQAQAAALVWFVPDERKVGDLRELADRFEATFRRAHQLEFEVARLTKERHEDAVQVGNIGHAVMDKINGERRKVVKTSGRYKGPGEVVATFKTRDGELRFVVAHTIAGGEGEFFHIYSEREIS